MARNPPAFETVFVHGAHGVILCYLLLEMLSSKNRGEKSGCIRQLRALRLAVGRRGLAEQHEYSGPG